METMQVLISINNRQEEKQTFPAILSLGTIQLSIDDLNKIIDILNIDPFKYNRYSLEFLKDYTNFKCMTRNGNHVQSLSTVVIDDIATFFLGEFIRMLSFPSIYNGKVTDLEGNVIVSMEWYKEDCDKRARWAETAAAKGKK